jgi:minimal PKS acyl carrier protein
MTAKITLEDVKRIMTESAGADESVDLDGDILDAPFADLGYDSLAVLELASRLQQQYPVSIPDEAVEALRTPGQVLTYVNSRLTA